ncbi:uncharacterized protein LOC6049926 [Culex quinquefasciatus]|uniref:uncharacterized protein LOC6049926 n=1 Tax=Culex quinquefasciatus TaxID=7176 RepID=UPI0018E2DB50|nr:uncharacterized protein LOC6049926 [Culex quinquefasciatus]
MTGVKGFLNRWSVTIVMIPALVGMHWGWFVLHKNEALVPKHQQKDELPIVSAARKFWKMFTKEEGGSVPEIKDVAAK